MSKEQPCRIRPSTSGLTDQSQPETCAVRPRSSPTARSRRCGASTVRARTRPLASSRTASLNPVATFADPLRGPKDVLVMCEVLKPDMSPHETNTRPRASRWPRSTPAPSRCSASSRSTRSSKTSDRTAGPRLVSPRPRVPTTAVSADRRCPDARSLKPTRWPACARASPSKAPTPK
jgi:hypothetical protein